MSGERPEVLRTGLRSSTSLDKPTRNQMQLMMAALGRPSLSLHITRLSYIRPMVGRRRASITLVSPKIRVTSTGMMECSSRQRRNLPTDCRTSFHPEWRP
jgi:hypothetical protein